jgi:hypothetical protein
MAAQQNFQGMDAIAIRQPSVEEILMLAVEKSAGADAIERLVSLQQQLLAKEAETDFNESMNKIQTELRPIQTDAINPSTKSKYASYHQLDRAIRPVYTKYGFSLSFSTTDSPLTDHVRVLCYVSRSGHTRTYQCDMPSDGKGAKGGDVMTKTHAAGSAMSYGMRYLLKMIFNIAVGEDDTDGNEPLPNWAQEYIDAFRGLTQINQLRDVFAEAWQKASGPNGDRRSKDYIRIAYEARKKEISNVNG